MEKIDKYIQILKKGEDASADEIFAIEKEISCLLCSSSDKDKSSGRILLIELLDKKQLIPEDLLPVCNDLVAAAGFYPYLSDNPADSFGELIRKGYHKSDYLDGYYLHAEQKKISSLILQHRNVIVSAPTSFGKSLLIEEVIASDEYKNIVIIQPTLALLDETRRRLKKYQNKYKLIVRTSQPKSQDCGNIFLLTAERVLEYPDLPQIDLLILDEFYKLSGERGDNRHNVLNTAFIRIMKNKSCRFYMLGPNIDSIPSGFVEKYDAVFYRTDYSLVITNELNKFDEVQNKKGGKVNEEDAFAILDELDNQAIIYCSSPGTARKLAFLYCNHLEERKSAVSSEIQLIEWINSNISHRWTLSKCLSYGIGVHDGAMPKHISSSTINYFNDKKLKYLFCTNTIIEGVNTSAKYVVYYDNTIGSRPVDYFDYSNIRGRAGRLMKHYVGEIINLKKPPVKAEKNVTFPFFEQNPIESEVLVNLDPDDVKDINDNKTRYEDFKNKDPELQEIFVRNAVSIEGQEYIYNRIYEDLKIPKYREQITWSKIDGKLYKRLEYLFTLCWDHLSTEKERKSFGSLAWVVNKIVSSCYNRTMNEMIDSELEYKARKLAEERKEEYVDLDSMFIRYPLEMQEKADYTIERMFAFQKNWLQYRAPKWINVVDSIQIYASKKLGLPSGDYSYVAEMIENEFTQANLRILLEYGVPKSAVDKIQCLSHKLALDKSMTEDEIIEVINRKKAYIEDYLSPYEIEVLNRVL